MELYNLAKSLILEVAGRGTIMDCMTRRERKDRKTGDTIKYYNIAEVFYDDGEDPGGKGRRWIEIYGYGVSKAGNDIIRVYQIGGDTKTIEPGWKTFRSDRMNGLRKLAGEFTTPRPLFRPDGDKDMIRIYKIIKFD